MKQISECNDYMREIVGTIDITSLTGTLSSIIKVNNICPNVNQLVVGGTNAKSGDFPHMVALGRRNSDQTFILMCGGTLISHNWVLSAAHCTYGPKYTFIIFPSP
jgi:secreted trypsin-like serine protease